VNPETGRWVTGREVQGIGRRALKQTVPGMLMQEITLAVEMDAGRCGVGGKKAPKAKRKR